MSKSAFTDEHRILVSVLVDARVAAGLRQADLAARIGRDQSFVSNVERGQRRVDVVDFVSISEALRIDPSILFQTFMRRLSKDRRHEA